MLSIEEYYRMNTKMSRIWSCVVGETEGILIDVAACYFIISWLLQHLMGRLGIDQELHSPRTTRWVVPPGGGCITHTTIASFLNITPFCCAIDLGATIWFYG